MGEECTCTVQCVGYMSTEPVFDIERVNSQLRNPSNESFIGVHYSRIVLKEFCVENGCHQKLKLFCEIPVINLSYLPGVYDQ